MSESSTPSPPVFQVGGATLRGHRTENQDRWLARRSEDGRRAVVAVADGVGGLPRGGESAAAAIAEVDAFADRFLADAAAGRSELRERLRELYAAADHRIVEMAGPGRSGTTLVLAVISATEVVVANVGDSRGWRLRGDRLDRITRDHSVVEEMVESGALSRDEADTSPRRNLLTRMLGDDEGGSVDLLPEPGAVLTLDPGDALILTSDGAHDVPELMDGPSIRRALEVASALDLDAFCEKLCRAAIAAGSRDNATMVVVTRPG